MPANRRVLIWGRPIKSEARSEERLKALKAKYEPRGVVFEELAFTKDREAALQILHDRQSNGPVETLLGYGWILNALSPINADFFKALPDLRCVTSAGAGYNGVDTEDLATAGVWYANTPDAVSTPTAVLASTLILSCIRYITHGDRIVRRGEWTGPMARGGLKMAKNPHELRIGILGMGNIGRKVVQQLRGFGCSFSYHNRRKLPEKDAAGAQYCRTLEELLSSSDVISVHVPLSHKTQHLISTTELAQMKRGSVLVNTARGAIIDEKAMVEALKSGHLASVGLDVFENEPEVHPYLLESDVAVLAPHMGGLTEGTLGGMESELCDNIDTYLETGRPIYAVNEAASR